MEMKKRNNASESKKHTKEETRKTILLTGNFDNTLE